MPLQEAFYFDGSKQSIHELISFVGLMPIMLAVPDNRYVIRVSEGRFEVLKKDELEAGYEVGLLVESQARHNPNRDNLTP